MFDPSQHDALLIKVLTMACQWSGCDFLRYNPGTMERRVGRRMIDVRCQTMADYLEYLEKHPEEYPRLVAGLTIKVSCFFRDSEMFALLEEGVLPQLFSRAKTSGRGQLRIWSTACAGGEEAYSLAILFAEQAAAMADASLSVSILATDLDPEALSVAAKGVYSGELLQMLGETLRSRYFVKDLRPGADLWQVTPQLRAMVDFVSFDLTSRSRLSPPSGIFAEYDLILCRNMLIYCQPALKREIIRRLFTCLGPGGYLVLGRSESLPEEYKECFTVVDPRFKIFIKEEKA